MRRVLVHLLCGEGYECDAVSDGDEAFESIGQGKPQVAIADMRVPQEEDLFFLGLLRKRHPQVAVIILFPGKAVVPQGDSEQVIDYDGALPPLQELTRAIDWAYARRMLSDLKPPAGMA